MAHSSCKPRSARRCGDAVATSANSSPAFCQFTWVDLDDAESPHDDLAPARSKTGCYDILIAAKASRCNALREGVCVWFVCTEGGPRELGQIWCYRPAVGNDTAKVRLRIKGKTHGTVLTAQARIDDAQWRQSRHDAYQRCAGVRGPTGPSALDGHHLGWRSVCARASNPRGNSELAGACFSRPARVFGTASRTDGEVLYLNLQSRGLTLAITGPWSSRDAAARTVILHVDMDAFFASVEERENPHLAWTTGYRWWHAGRTRGRGRSELRSAQIRNPQRHARDAGRTTVSARGVRAFANGSLRRSFTADPRRSSCATRLLMEPLSLDEAFLDVGGSERLFGGADDIAARIKQQIREELQLVASVGVARNKFLAKLAGASGEA